MAHARSPAPSRPRWRKRARRVKYCLLLGGFAHLKALFPQRIFKCAWKWPIVDQSLSFSVLFWLPLFLSLFATRSYYVWPRAVVVTSDQWVLKGVTRRRLEFSPYMLSSSRGYTTQTLTTQTALKPALNLNTRPNSVQDRPLLSPGAMGPSPRASSLTS